MNDLWVSAVEYYRPRALCSQWKCVIRRRSCPCTWAHWKMAFLASLPGSGYCFELVAMTAGSSASFAECALNRQKKGRKALSNSYVNWPRDCGNRPEWMFNLVAGLEAGMCAINVSEPGWSLCKHTSCAKRSTVNISKGKHWYRLPNGMMSAECFTYLVQKVNIVHRNRWLTMASF